MDIMHIKVHAFGDDNFYGLQALNLLTETGLGFETLTKQLSIYLFRPAGIFCMDVKTAPINSAAVQWDNVLDAYRAYRAAVWYQKGLLFGELLKSGATPEEYPWPLST